MAVALFLLLAGMALLHLLFTPWAALFLYGADSVTLALLAQSVLAGEPFQWILSSQVFVFPEAPIYFFSRLLAGNPKYALFVNGFLNLVILYFGYRTVGRIVLKSKKANGFAISSLALIVFFMLCETRLDVNNGSIANLILFNTYYCGVIFSALFLIAMYAAASPSMKLTRRPTILGTGAFLVTGLTYFSDPLILLQFSVPLVLATLVMWVIGRLKTSNVIFVVATQGAGIVVGNLLRRVFHRYIGASVDSYLHFDRMLAAIRDLVTTVRALAISRLSTAEYSVILLIFVSALLLSLYLLHGSRASFFDGNRRTTSIVQLFLLFYIASSAVTTFGVIASGNFYTRYLLPIVFFSPLGILPLFLIEKTARQGLRILSAAMAVLLLLTAKIVSGGSLANADSPNVDCYNHYMKQGAFNSLGGYWSSRELDLYSDTGARVLQISGLKKERWLNNDGAYYGRTFNGLVVDRGKGAPDHIYMTDADKLGPYTKKMSCPSFDILYYAEGTEGYRMLNTIAKR